MKYVLVMAFLINGQLGFSETGSYDSLEACKATFHRLLERYLADGVPLENINGDCYIRPLADAQ